MFAARSSALIAAENLLIHGGKMVIGIGVELALIQRVRLHHHRRPVCVRISLGSGKAIDASILRRQSAQHMVERAVLHH